MSIERRFNSRRYGRVETATSTPSIHYVDEVGLTHDLMDQIRGNQDIAKAIADWTEEATSGGEVSYDMFNRDRWQGARHTFALMSKCAWSVENDDILGTLSDVVESLAFNKCRFKLFDNDQEDVWNQWAAEINLDSLLRMQFRELFKVSQVYVGMWWERRIYEVRDTPIDGTIKEYKLEMEKKQAELMGTDAPEAKGPGRGNRSRKKKFPVEMPVAFTIFEPTKILPVGNLMFGRERFAYIANRAEASAFDQALAGTVSDPTVVQLIEGHYEPTQADVIVCGDLGIDTKNLYLFKEDALFRHTLTKASYERFAPIRLKSVLPILEMKGHLRSSDRASLIGNTNFIVVIKKGTDKLPAKAAEIENLQEQARIVARLPVLVGDHRLSVEIVAPPLDNTLIESRWQVLDSRLVFRALNTFTPLVQGGNASGAGVSEMSRIVSKGIENRRHMLVRDLEAHVFKTILKRNEGVLSEDPNLLFNPRRVTLDVDQDIVNAMLKLRDRGDISRETTLEELDFDQDLEVQRRAKEKIDYDQVFQSGTPYGSPQMNPYGAPAQPGQPGQPAQPTEPGQPKSGSTPEGGRPAGVTESKPRQTKGTLKA